MLLVFGTAVPLAVFHVLTSLGAGLFCFIFLRSSWLTPVKGPKEKFGFQLSEQHHAARRVAFHFQQIYALTLILVLFDMLRMIYYFVSAPFTDYDYDELGGHTMGSLHSCVGLVFLGVDVVCV